jgi:trimeric autotransporter adhesin
VPTTHAITTTGVANAAPQAVYQSARIGSSFSYTVSGLTPGVPYTVRLHFAEIGSVTAAGQRVLNVAANGVSLLSNLDLFAAGGGKAFVAIVRQFTVTADSLGSIKLLFTAVVGNALLSWDCPTL